MKQTLILKLHFDVTGYSERSVEALKTFLRTTGESAGPEFELLYENDASQAERLLQQVRKEFAEHDTPKTEE